MVPWVRWPTDSPTVIAIVSRLFTRRSPNSVPLLKAASR